MNSREWVFSVIEGKPVEHFPVIVPYSMLSNADHWVEVTGEPVYTFYQWILSSPDEHAKYYQKFDRAMPFDHFQPWFCPSREERESISIVIKNDKALYYDKRDDSFRPVPVTIHESGSGGGENEARHIFALNDINKAIKIETADQIIAKGSNDYIEAAIPLMNDKFFINTGVVNTFYSCVYYVGMENFYCMLIDEPDLIHAMSQRILEKNIEQIRAAAKAGGDAIYIDDATATSDMISVEMYEEFSLPYITEQVREIKRLGKKAILVYFGGISDRIEQIVSTGVDLLVMEASMKGFTNDYEKISRQINGRCCLAGNLNPYTDVELKNDHDLEEVIHQQALYGRRTGKYITSTGSPLTPGTRVERIAKMIEIGHSA